MRYLAILAAFFLASAHAATQTTDFSDLWYNQDEEGWGVNLAQQDDILFITFFVYGTNGQPTWFVGPATLYTGSTSDGILSFTGPLFTTTGPYFGAGSFNESQVGNRQVGSVSFATSQIATGAISYSVDGVTVTKTIERQTWRNENVGGVYVGGVAGNYSSCGAARNGYFEGSVTLTVGHDGGATINMREDGPNYTCNYAGSYSQAGRMGRIAGTATCTDGLNQSFVASEVQGGLTGLTMRLVSQFDGGCLFNGRIGGVRRGS